MQKAEEQRQDDVNDNGEESAAAQEQEAAAAVRLASARTPFITGVQTVKSGKLPAADAITILGVRPPRYLFYMVSGAMCDIVQLALDLALHRGFGVSDPSVCWAVTFALSVVVRHTSHRYLVFGRFVGGYWHSLGRMYGGYSVIIVLSTLFNWAVTSAAGLPHYVAWVATLLWTGIANYFILKKLWAFGGNADGTGAGKSKEAAGKAETRVRVRKKKKKGNRRVQEGEGGDIESAGVAITTGRGKEALTSRRAVVV